MFNNPTGAGTMTSGGTESIIMAVKGCRDWARDTKGIIEPEMLVYGSGPLAIISHPLQGCACIRPCRVRQGRSVPENQSSHDPSSPGHTPGRSHKGQESHVSPSSWLILLKFLTHKPLKETQIRSWWVGKINSS